MAAIYDRADKFRQELLAMDRDASSLLVDAYGQAWQRAQQELEGVLRKMEDALAAGEPMSPAWLYQEQRLKRAQAQLEAGIRQFVDQADLLVQDAQAEAVEAAQRHLSTAVVDEALEAGVAGVADTFTRMPEEALGQLVGHLADGSPLRRLLEELPDQAGEVFAKALVEGVALGENPRRIAGRVREAMGGNLARALTIARTEVVRSYRESSRLGMAANADVVKGWRWICARQRRTCAACWAMHGTEHALEERLDGHPNCRCVPMPITRSWEELGAPRGTPDTNPDVTPGPEEFDALPEADQLAVLGPAKFERYKAGELNLPDLVGRRDSADWGSTRYERSLKQLDAELEAGLDTAEWRLGPDLEPAPMPADLRAAVRQTRARHDRADLEDAAGRLGLEPDELAEGMAQLTDVRAAARAEAAEVRDASRGWLDRNAEGGRLAQPPRAVRKLDAMGHLRWSRPGAGGEWDWLETLDPLERKRLNRYWLDRSGIAPDVMGQTAAHTLGLDLEDAIQEWLHHTRVVDAAGALQRGRLPNMRAYGNLNVDALAPEVAGEGWDLAALFGDDFTAGAHVYRRQADLAAEFAARAIRPAQLGPAPWRMEPWAFREEVLELESAVRAGEATTRTWQRLEELIPDGLEDPTAPLPLEHLHQAVVALARQAGLT